MHDWDGTSYFQYISAEYDEIESKCLENYNTQPAIVSNKLHVKKLEQFVARYYSLDSTQEFWLGTQEGILYGRLNN